MLSQPGLMQERKSQNPEGIQYKLRNLPLMTKITIILYEVHAIHTPVEYYSFSCIFFWWSPSLSIRKTRNYVQLTLSTCKNIFSSLFLSKKYNSWIFYPQCCWQQQTLLNGIFFLLLIRVFIPHTEKSQWMPFFDMCFSKHL